MEEEEGGAWPLGLGLQGPFLALGCGLVRGAGGGNKGEGWLLPGGARMPASQDGPAVRCRWWPPGLSSSPRDRPCQSGEPGGPRVHPWQLLSQRGEWEWRAGRVQGPLRNFQELPAPSGKSPKGSPESWGQWSVLLSQGQGGWGLAMGSRESEIFQNIGTLLVTEVSQQACRVCVCISLCLLLY